tara:strand:+ start:59 stop:229 length:171 start_codon:yes stop_codon:yes gene_type:complete
MFFCNEHIFCDCFRVVKDKINSILKELDDIEEEYKKCKKLEKENEVDKEDYIVIDM